MEDASISDISWLGEVGKLLAATATGWFGRLATERSKRRTLRRGLYKEMAHNAAMFNLLSSQSAAARGDQWQQGAVRPMLRKSYFEEARVNRSSFDDLAESYIIEDIYHGFDWALEDVSHYPPGVVQSRLRGALYRIGHQFGAGQLDRRLLLRMAPRVHRAALRGAFKRLAEDEKNSDGA